MQLGPVLSSLRQHKLTALLLILQTAFSCAIVTNAMPMIVDRIERISMPSGVDDERLSLIAVADIQQDGNHQVQHASDLAALRRIAGVESAVALGQGLPFSGGQDSYGVCGSAEALRKASGRAIFEGGDCVGPDVYSGSAGFVPTMGVHLQEGRDFTAADYSVAVPATAMLTRALAARLYPGGSALGKTVFTSAQQLRVVGIVADVARPLLRGAGKDHLVMLWPQLPDAASSTYLLRSAPAERGKILQAARAALVKVNPNRLFPDDGQQSYSAVRAKYFQRDVTMIGLLLAAGLGLLFVTALGISGLANFWVQQRRRTIGIRRAVGATRGDILRYFQLENALIVCGGIVLGLLLALTLNLALMHFYELPRMPFYYLPIGAVTLWLLGQLSVLGPALRAAAVPPVVATRSC